MPDIGQTRQHIASTRLVEGKIYLFQFHFVLYVTGKCEESVFHVYAGLGTGFKKFGAILNSELSLGEKGKSDEKGVKNTLLKKHTRTPSENINKTYLFPFFLGHDSSV